MDIKNQLLMGLLAAAAGAASSFTIWAKSKESFDLIKFSQTIILAFGVGFISGFWGVPEDMLMSSPIYGYATGIIENLVKAVYRWIQARKKK